MTPRASYGARSLDGVGGVIARVDAGSPAARAGLRAGDTILSANGAGLRDVLDWQWETDGTQATLTVRRKGERRAAALELKRAPGEAWGIEFGTPLFDAVRTCRNRCAFCFMAQLPKGLRRALYVRDDDFRLSFLQGNFISLTNLSDADVERIGEQHLSPLYVSLHAVDPQVRERLICAREDRALERFDELLGVGIGVHVQIVLVPDVNDGDVLDDSLRWLAQREGVLSVGVVPLGFTAHQERFAASFGDAESARSVIRQVSAWQQAFRARDGVNWVYLADEFYLDARQPVPPAEEYDDFPQYENGIGLVRSFLDDFESQRAAVAAAAAGLPPEVSVALVTGELFAPVLREALASADSSGRLSVLAIPNRFFGGNVSVTGLLAGADILQAIRDAPSCSAFLVPNIVMNSDGVLLDDVPADQLAARSGTDVRLLSCDAGGLLAALQALAAAPPSPTRE